MSSSGSRLLSRLCSVSVNSEVTSIPFLTIEVMRVARRKYMFSFVPKYSYINVFWYIVLCALLKIHTLWKENFKKPFLWHSFRSIFRKQEKPRPWCFVTNPPYRSLSHSHALALFPSLGFFVYLSVFLPLSSLSFLPIKLHTRMKYGDWIAKLRTAGTTLRWFTHP